MSVSQPDRIELTESWIRSRYIDVGQTMESMSEETGWSVKAIRNAMKRYGIASRSRGQKPRHGHARKLHNTSTYGTWRAMHRRCEDPSLDEYHRYGGRGISVCERWSVFDNFLADMGVRPTGLTIDRIDNNGNYEPSNCRWADRITQNRNHIRCSNCGSFVSHDAHCKRCETREEVAA